jgi:hypothetical protein
MVLAKMQPLDMKEIKIFIIKYQQHGVANNFLEGELRFSL